LIGRLDRGTPSGAIYGVSAVADDLRERTLRYALRILSYCRQLPDTSEVRELGKQLLHAGMGVAGNYRSACRGRSDREFVAKLGVSVDEAEESVLWLMVVLRSGIRGDGETKDLLREGTEIRAILSRSHKTARENRRKAREKKTRNQLTKPETR
jgi:four helix bundle protein